MNKAMFLAPIVAGLMGTALIASGDQERELPNGMQAVLFNGSTSEQEAADQLARLAESYDLTPYVFTNKIQFKEMEIPHSHPVLTLNTRYIEHDNHALSTFLHEQVHWFMESKKEDEKAAIEALKAIYPKVPVRGGEGARDEYSTYLHLMVCMEEYDALANYMGEEMARKTIEQKRHYKWIYKQVLENPDQIRSVMTDHGLVINS